MARRPLDPDTMLGVTISATISRHRYDKDPTDLITELLQLAGDRGDILAQEAGRWAGFYGEDLGVQPELVAALRSRARRNGSLSVCSGALLVVIAHPTRRYVPELSTALERHFRPGCTSSGWKSRGTFRR